jgi:hypothetical protein
VAYIVDVDSGESMPSTALVALALLRILLEWLGKLVDLIVDDQRLTWWYERPTSRNPLRRDS